jgi:WD40 repeat protein
MPLTGHTRAVTTAAWGQLHDPPVLGTGSEDRTVRLWKQPDGSAMLRLSEPVTDIAFLPDGSIAISGASGFAIVKTNS